MKRLPYEARLSWLAAAVVTVLLCCPGIASAGSCSGDCEGENCNGGCTINHPTCGTACVDDGCPGRAICQVFGQSATGLDCTHEVTSNCVQPQDEVPGGPEHPGLLRTAPTTEWAVIAYDTNPLDSLSPDRVAVLATSSRVFAQGATEELMIAKRKSVARMRQRVRSEGLRIDRTTFEQRYRYAVSPAECFGVGLEVAKQNLDGAEKASLLLRVTADAEGSVVAAQVLHSTANGSQARMVQFVKANTRLWRQDGGSGPFEAFVVFFTQDDGSAGWIVSGSQPLL